MNSLALTRDRRHKSRLLLGLVVICLLAFALRLYELEGQSLWSDEGLSLYRAQQPAAEVFANTITVDGVRTVDTNPPFYFLLLRGWYVLFGEHVFLLRTMGVLAGTLSIPLLYVLGRALFSWRVGVLAALFLAVSPFHVWQTQVLRNYALLITINLFSVYGVARYILARSGSRKRWSWAALWLGAGLLGVYTHYFGFFVLAFTLAAFVLPLLQRWWTERRVRRAAVKKAGSRARLGLGKAPWLWVGLLLALAIALPALLVAFSRFQAGRQVDFFHVGLLDVAGQAASAFSVGMSRSLRHPWWRVAPGMLLFITGAWWSWRRRRPSTLFLLGYQLVPLGLLLALSTINPLFNGTRHLLIGLPPFLLLGAIAPAALSAPGITMRPVARRLALFLAALFLVVQVVWLERQFHDPQLVRDDVRAAAEFLNRRAAPDDVIVLHDSLIKFTFDAYYDGQAPVAVVPLYGRQDRAEAVARLQAAGEQGEVVWFLTQPEPRTGFPREFLVDWADEHWHPLMDERFPWMWLRVRLRAYSARPQRDTLPAGVTEQGALFDHGLQLHGLSMPTRLESGQTFAVTYYMSRNGVPGSENPDYGVSLRFTDEAGQLWGQVDGGLWPAYPPPVWPRDQLVRYDHFSRLPVGLPPGVYQVWMRILDRGGQGPLTLQDGGADLRLPDVTVDAAGCRQPLPDDSGLTPAADMFGTSLELRGVSQPAQTYRPGHALTLDMLWCARRSLPEEHVMRLQMVSVDGEIVAQSQAALTRPDYPATEWEPDRLLRGKIQMATPAIVPEGFYELQLSVLSADGERALPVNLGLSGRTLDIGEVEIEAWPMETDFPPIATAHAAQFGDPPLFELHGYDLGSDALAPDGTAPLTLYWRAVQDAPPLNYHVFVHVVRDGETPVTQADGAPLNGFRPTSSWRAGEVFVDERLLSVPPDAAAGAYRLTVGLYNPDTGERLPAFVDGERVENDAVRLQDVTIRP